MAAPYRLAGRNFALRALENEWPGARLGLVASRKAAPRAVDRNRGKRLAREVFRAVRAQLPALDIVFLLRNDLRKVSNRILREELVSLLHDVSKRFGTT